MSSYIGKVAKVAVAKVELLPDPGIVVHVGVLVLENCHSYAIVAVELPEVNVAKAVESILPSKTPPEQIVVAAAVAIVPPLDNFGTYTVIESVALHPDPFSVITVKTVSPVIPDSVAVTKPVVLVNSRVVEP